MKSILLPGTSQISTVISDTCNHVNNFAENGAKKQRPISIMSGNSFLLGQEDYLKHTKSGIMRIFLLLVLSFLLCFGFVPTTSAAVTGPGAAWQYCRRITLSPVTTLADFQVKVTLTTAALGNPYTNVKADGSDLRFYDISNNLCNYWIETWTNSGTSTIWVKVPVSGTTYLYMYYGNTSAAAVTNGTNTFAFFDGFDGSSLGGNWASSSTNGTIAVSGGTVTISCTSSGGPNTTPVISSAFTPSSTSFFLEAKHRETSYNRVRFYATTSLSGVSPIAVGDYGYFYNGGGAQNAAQVYWGGYPGSNSLANNTDYLTRWQITDGSTYNWYTLLYSTGAAITNGTRTTTFGTNIRYITMGVTEVSGTSTIVDWVRVRKYVASEPAASMGSQVTNISASITAQTNVLCNGLSTGSATVTASGGSGGYTYLWNSTPAQSTQIAINLPAGTFIATVTDIIGLTVTAQATITQPVTAISASVDVKSDIKCFNGSDGSITIRATGGTGPYNYSVDDGVSWTPALPVLPNPYQFGGLNVANNPYRVKVKDSNGCISR